MKKLFLTLLIVIPFVAQAQNDSMVNLFTKRIYNEITGEKIYSVHNWMIGECISDNSEVGGQDMIDCNYYQTNMLFDISPCNSRTTNFWMSVYDVIYGSNRIIAEVEKTSFSAEQKKQTIAEAKFIRSLMYFELTRNFGAVPLYLDTTGFTSFEDGLPYKGYCYQTKWNKERSTIAQVYAQIEGDLKESIDALPEKNALTADNKYIATKGAARALLAKIYLYQSSYAKNYPNDARFAGLTQQWDKALQYAEDVISSGQYKLVGIDKETYTTYWDSSYLYKGKTTGFRYAFSEEGNYCPESVFECKNDYTTYSEIASNYLSVYNTCRYYEGGSYEIFGWGFNIPTQNLIDEFAKESGKASDDPRFKATIGIAGDSILINKNGNPTYYKMDYRNLPIPSTCRKFESSGNSEYWSIGHYYDGKFNVRLIRYADVMLMASEAALMSGDSNKALIYLNKVRERARACDSTGYPKALGSITLDDIIRERRLELAMEGHRFYDLVRWNLAETKLNGRLNATYNKNVTFTKGVNELFPIPSDVVRSSEGVVAQNAGYEEVCPYISVQEALCINNSLKETVLGVDYSGNKLVGPVAHVYSKSTKANVSLNDKKLTIKYNNLVAGDTINVVFSVVSGTNDSIYTTIVIRVLTPVYTLNANELNYVRTTSYGNLIESKTDLSNYNLPTKYFYSYCYFENGERASLFNVYNKTVTALGRPVFAIAPSAFALKTAIENGTISKQFNVMVVLKKSNVETAIMMPVDVSKILPTITVTNISIKKDQEFTIPVYVSAIDTNSFCILDQQYYSKLSRVKLYVTYNDDNFEYVSHDFKSTIFENEVRDSTNKSNNNLYLEATNKTPIVGDTVLVNLHFKALTDTVTSFENWLMFSDSIDYLYSPALYEYKLKKDSVIVTPPINGILNNQLNQSISFYPNPVIDYLYISSSSYLKGYAIFDVNGRVVLQGSLNGTTEKIAMSKLSSGVYVIKVKGSNGIDIRRFVKK